MNEDSAATGEHVTADAHHVDLTAERRPAPGTAAVLGASAPGRPGADGEPAKGRSWWAELPVLFLIAVVLALVIKTYVVQAFYIPSSSMEDTLRVGDKVLVSKLVYDLRPIHRGDIIVFNGDGSWNPRPRPEPLPVRAWESVESLFGTATGQTDYIKRVIGLPGDRVVCCNAHGLITVNGVPLHESSYLYPGNRPFSSPLDITSFRVTVPPGHLWVMGDHRAVSDDSRLHRDDPGGGSIPESAVVGRAFVIVWPPSQWRFLPIPATFGQPGLAPRATAAAPGPAGPPLPAGTGTVAPLPGPAGPASLGMAGAVPLTWLERRLRRRLRRRR